MATQGRQNQGKLEFNAKTPRGKDAEMKAESGNPLDADAIGRTSLPENCPYANVCIVWQP
jgi:hypothetical protein